MWETVVGLFPNQFLSAFLLGNRLALVEELQENVSRLLSVLEVLYSLAENETHACLQGHMHNPIEIQSSQGHPELRLGSPFCTVGRS